MPLLLQLEQAQPTSI